MDPLKAKELALRFERLAREASGGADSGVVYCRAFVLFAEAGALIKGDGFWSSWPALLRPGNAIIEAPPASNSHVDGVSMSIGGKDAESISESLVQAIIALVETNLADSPTPTGWSERAPFLAAHRWFESVHYNAISDSTSWFLRTGPASEIRLPVAAGLSAAELAVLADRSAVALARIARTEPDRVATKEAHVLTRRGDGRATFSTPSEVVTSRSIDVQRIAAVVWALGEAVPTGNLMRIGAPKGGRSEDGLKDEGVTPGESTQDQVDAQTVRALKERLEDLDVSSEDREDIEGYLKNATGLAGKSRAFVPRASRARKSVNQSLKRGYERIEEQAPELAEHLRASISEKPDGFSYKPNPLRRWDLRTPTQIL